MTEHFEPQLHSIAELRKSFPSKPFYSLEALRVPTLLQKSFRFTLGFMVLFIAFLLFVPWQQVSSGEGRVIAYSSENRQQSVESPIMGRIERWLVQEGQVVHKGQPIVELSDVDPNILSRLTEQKKALTSQLESAKQALRLSQKNLDRQRLLSKQGLSSDRDFELAQIEVAEKEQKFSAIEGEISELDVRLSRQESQVVKSPFEGTLVRIIEPEGGSMVSAGATLATLVPSTQDRAVQIMISGIDLPLLEEGRKARLIFEGWPAVQFSGWPSIAVGSFGGEVQVIDAVDDGKGNYRVLIFPDPEDMPWPSTNYLRQGVRVNGWVLLDRVPLWWELWRKLNGFPKTIETFK
jgi:multidrug efflux pump subunit AcrA (membrane-fusion protein)